MSMPASMSVCSRCSAALVPGQDICSCGQVITARDTPDNALLVQAETLYESYLQTRVRSAERALQAARIQLARRPTSASLSARVYECTRELKTAEAKLVDQRLRTDAVRRDSSETVAPSAGPSEAFRSTQSVKADIALARLQVERLRDIVAAGEPSAQFEAKAAAHAERILKNRQRDTSPCPACGLPLPHDATHCGCGFAVSRAARETSSEFLSTEEIAALRRSR
ncbi:MAG: hypothetical protein AMJ84_11840 [Acidithiobacillales bacterium SM23_46]|nr:MAG: hypothetical protein AMJ84_11840 [Acidithiobacillales bacterium SM23_46]KPL27228.1 MAG: hypothetical protein AMJ72_10015 [Acidithiobacillales bacterium SM1_46]